MASPGVSQAIEELRGGLEDIATEVEAVQADAQADKDELTEMVKTLREQVTKDINTIGAGHRNAREHCRPERHHLRRQRQARIDQREGLHT